MPEEFLVTVIKVALIAFVLITAVAYIQFMERRVMAFMQSRIGPNRVGPFGLLQPGLPRLPSPSPGIVKKTSDQPEAMPLTCRLGMLGMIAVRVVRGDGPGSSRAYAGGIPHEYGRINGEYSE